MCTMHIPYLSLTLSSLCFQVRCSQTLPNGIGDGLKPINLNPHTVLFIHNRYWFLCRKLREYSARSYWSTAEPCDNRQRTSIGRQAEKTGNLLLFVDSQIIEGSQRILYPVSRAYTCQIFSFSYSLLGNEPISRSHFSSF